MDQPVAITSNSLRDDLGPGSSMVTASKPTRKTSSFEREGWWRIALTNTPIPGTYHLKTFIEESLLNPVIATYNFKNEGRKKPPLVQRNDPVLNDLPLYTPPDFLDLLKKQVATYSFKDKPRSSPSRLVYKDQSVKLSPGQYDLLPAPVPKHASRSFVFRSTVQRFPTSYFTPLLSSECLGFLCPVPWCSLPEMNRVPCLQCRKGVRRRYLERRGLPVSSTFNHHLPIPT